MLGYTVWVESELELWGKAGLGLGCGSSQAVGRFICTSRNTRIPGDISAAGGTAVLHG